MSMKTTLRLSREGSLEEGTPAEVAEKKRRAHEEELRPARLEVARRNSRWTEIEADFVARGRNGYWLVSVSSDHVYTRACGEVFQSGSVAAVSDFAPLFFTVDADGDLTFYEREPWTWTEHLEQQAKREQLRNAPKPRPRWMDATK
jgi:hypothetical protein